MEAKNMKENGKMTIFVKIYKNGTSNGYFEE